MARTATAKKLKNADTSAQDAPGRYAPSPHPLVPTSLVLRYGGLSPRATVAEGLALPVLTDLPSIALTIDALDQAVTERKGVVLIAQPGAGKSMAVDYAESDFDQNEDARIDRDSGQPRRMLLRLRAPRARRAVDVMDAMHHALTGSSLVTKEHGKRIPEDEVLRAFVAQLLQADIAAVILDEAQNLSDTGLQVVRDIISEAEARSERRYSADRKLYVPGGVGFLLVGTPDLKPRIELSMEAGRRWLRVQELRALTPTKAAAVYRRFLPCLEAEAQRDEAAWQQFVQTTICPQRVPISAIENHVRHYVRRMVNANPSVGRTEDVPFDRSVFVGTWTERAGQVYADPEE